MKKFLGISLIAATAAIAVGLSGCSSCSSKVRNTAALNANWYIVTGYNGMQTPFLEDEKSFERAVYSVTYSDATAANGSYSAEYEEGEYTTYFTGKTFDLSLLDESYREEYEEAQKDENGSARPMVLYYFQTELKIGVTFKRGDETVTFTGDDGNYMFTECYFRTTGEGLQPVYSAQKIVSYSPRAQQASNVNSAYEKVVLDIKTSYRFDEKQAIVVTSKDGGEPEKNEIRVGGDSFFDNNSLYVVARAMSLADGSSQSVTLFDPTKRQQGNYSITGGKASIGDESLKRISEIPEIKSALGTREITNDDGEKVTVQNELSYVCSEITYSGELRGTAQTVWYAGVTDSSRNTTRAVMLKRTEELPYALGALNYELKEITFANC